MGFVLFVKRGLMLEAGFFLKVPKSAGGGQTWDLFDFGRFSLTSSALDNSATAPSSGSWVIKTKPKAYRDN